MFRNLSNGLAAVGLAAVLALVALMSGTAGRPAEEISNAAAALDRASSDTEAHAIAQQSGKKPQMHPEALRTLSGISSGDMYALRSASRVT